MSLLPSCLPKAKLTSTQLHEHHPHKGRFPEIFCYPILVVQRASRGIRRINALRTWLAKIFLLEGVKLTPISLNRFRQIRLLPNPLHCVSSLLLPTLACRNHVLTLIPQRRPPPPGEHGPRPIQRRREKESLLNEPLTLRTFHHATPADPNRGISLTLTNDALWLVRMWVFLNKILIWRGISGSHERGRSGMI